MDAKQQKIRGAYLKVFSSDDGAIVLQHLVEFARADSAEFCNDPRKDAYLQGRRSVVLEIRNIMKEKKDE